MRDGAPLAIVGMLGSRLEKERTGWRDLKALVLFVAISSDDWAPAADLADALGIAPDLQEAIYEEAQLHKQGVAKDTPRAARPKRARVFHLPLPWERASA